MSLGIETWGGGSRRTRGKASKLDIIHEIKNHVHVKSLDISVLNIKDLKTILEAAKNPVHRLAVETPVCRTKQPYIDIIKGIIPDVGNLEKLSVASLKELIGAFSNG